MIVRVEDWDGEPAIRLPDEMVNELSLRDGMMVELVLDNGKLLVRPLSSPRNSLEELLAKITPENLHGEWDIGPPVGREILPPYDA